MLTVIMVGALSVALSLPGLELGNQLGAGIGERPAVEDGHRRGAGELLDGFLASTRLDLTPFSNPNH